ncbi:hypothetical protein HPP92_006864 [Vanilla planifolia]|uniref:Uncharacterized protein n=1 Tax=Vanilla planifolia TaxID=51239 RepID=A0A835RCT2_VANPL|nr:hypothetical protein HPP92_006864 [Vanilla planifolia]
MTPTSPNNLINNHRDRQKEKRESERLTDLCPGEDECENLRDSPFQQPAYLAESLVLRLPHRRYRRHTRSRLKKYLRKSTKDRQKVKEIRTLELSAEIYWSLKGEDRKGGALLPRWKRKPGVRPRSCGRVKRRDDGESGRRIRKRKRADSRWISPPSLARG